MRCNLREGVLSCVSSPYGMILQQSKLSGFLRATPTLLRPVLGVERVPLENRILAARQHSPEVVREGERRGGCARPFVSVLCLSASFRPSNFQTRVKQRWIYTTRNSVPKRLWSSLRIVSHKYGCPVALSSRRTKCRWNKTHPPHAHTNLVKKRARRLTDATIKAFHSHCLCHSRSQKPLAKVILLHPAT